MHPDKHRESFELPIEYQGKEQLLEACLVPMGYTYKIYVRLGNAEIVFERDEEGSFRALMDNPDQANGMDRQLIRVIGESLEKHLS